MRTAFRRLSWALLLVLAIGASASAQETITISGSITTRSDGLAVNGAVVSVVGANLMTTSDVSGRYTLNVPRSAARRERVQLKVDALGLPPEIGATTSAASTATTASRSQSATR